MTALQKFDKFSKSFFKKYVLLSSYVGKDIKLVTCNILKIVLISVDKGEFSHISGGKGAGEEKSS